MRKNLDPSISEQIDKMLEICRFYEENGEIGKLDELAEKIWETIPEPKYIWDFYPQAISYGMMKSHRDLQLPKGAQRWIERSRAAYGPERDEMVELMAAMIAFDAGYTEEAMLEFDYQYKSFGKSIFVDEPTRYQHSYNIWRNQK
jgi:hypothetical protein